MIGSRSPVTTPAKCWASVPNAGVDMVAVQRRAMLSANDADRGHE